MATVTTPIDTRKIHSGAKVIGPKGEKIGTVHSQSSGFSRKDESYLLVEKKIMLFRTGFLYIPVSAIAGVQNGEVTLNVSQADVPDNEWKQAPKATES